MVLTSPLKLKWNGSIQGKGSIQSLFLSNSIAIPTMFGGTGEGNSPIDLLVSSAASCYLLTLVGMLNAQKLDDIELILNTETDPESKKLTINHFLEVIIPNEFNDNQINIIKDIINKADRGCHIGNMLRKAEVEIYVKGLVKHK
ncbi:OsmC family protein [Acinetobacter towneri]|mgnify:FL=1|uniref:OsmC family protein n=1 Tax=Acinetobacter towneri TaxID=202956 RepID=UPI003214B078